MFLCSELPEIGAFSFAKEVMNEGDFAQISCIVTSGDQPLTISWSILVIPECFIMNSTS